MLVRLATERLTKSTYGSWCYWTLDCKCAELRIHRTLAGRVCVCSYSETWNSQQGVWRGAGRARDDCGARGREAGARALFSALDL